MAVAKRESVLPAQRTVELAEAVTADGGEMTSTGAVFTAEASPQTLLATSVYTPEPADCTVAMEGFWAVEVKPLGPVHRQAVAPVAAPVSISVAFAHTGAPLAVAETLVGTPWTTFTTTAFDARSGHAPYELTTR